MIFTPVKLDGSFVIDVEKKGDQRGFFARILCRDEIKKQNLVYDFVQANISFNAYKGTLRGMHYQTEPYQEVKLVRCTRGAIYDVIIDLRPESPTYMQWFGIELTEDNCRSLYIPEGFAHGYQTLTDNSEVMYHVSQFYMPDYERGTRWDDPAFSIEWPRTKSLIISDKDRQWPDFPE